MRVAKLIFLVLVILLASFDIRAEEDKSPAPVPLGSFDEEEFKKFVEREEQKKREEQKIIRLRRARSLKCTYERASTA